VKDSLSGEDKLVNFYSSVAGQRSRSVQRQQRHAVFRGVWLMKVCERKRTEASASERPLMLRECSKKNTYIE
jgi:hypothetical protein